MVDAASSTPRSQREAHAGASGVSGAPSGDPPWALVTGATGFVGPYVVAALLGAGFAVRALVRNPDRIGGLHELRDHPRLDIVPGDLVSRADLIPVVSGAAVLVHLAAAKGGDYTTRFQGTVVGTENLLNAARDAGVHRLVAISSFSVYDYRGLRRGDVLDERTPVITDPGKRDEYAETKAYQDELYWDFGADDDNTMVMLRPGMIYGRDEMWHPLLSGELGPLAVRVGTRARPPITYVENTARAIALAARRLIDEPSAVDGEIINIVDDDLPTQSEYVAKLRAVADRPGIEDLPRAVTVPFSAMRFSASAASLINRRLLSSRAKLPGIAVPEQLDARFRHLTYPNAKAKRLLGWEPTFDVDEAIERAASGAPLLADLVMGGVDGR